MDFNYIHVVSYFQHSWSVNRHIVQKENNVQNFLYDFQHNFS